MATKEQIEHLRELLDKAHALMSEAAQYAGENDIPLKYIDPNYEEPEEGDEEDYEYRAQMEFVQISFHLHAGAAHHEVRDDLNIGLLHDQDVVAVKTACVVDLDTTPRTLISLLGIHDSVIVFTDDAVLIAAKSESQRIKEIVAKISADPEFKNLV